MTTKVVATLGPASSSQDQIAALIRAGASVLRLNFSHGSYEEHAARIAAVRECAARLDRPVAILQDLQGPKLRTGPLVGGQPVQLRAGQPLEIVPEPVVGDAARIGCTYEGLGRDLRPGDRVLLSDGLIELRVEASEPERVSTRVVHGGVLKESQGINLPSAFVSAPALSDKDLEDLRFGVAMEVDYIALSFVRDPKDVALAKQRVADAGGDQPVIAKIERVEAIERLEEVLDAADGAMVARGDLGVEIAPERVPILQKTIIASCNERGIPVITATQMLESMIENPRATRAEISDVANAVLDGSDAVMLSGETAIGRHPARAVATMKRVAEEVLAATGESRLRRSSATATVDSDPEAIAAAVAGLARARGADAIFAVTQSGNTARLISKHRPPVPILAFTPSERAYRRMSLLWGVIPLRTQLAHSGVVVEEDAVAMATERGLVHPGQTVVFTGSHPFHREAPTNFLKLRRI